MRNARRTILGADNKAAVAAMLEAARRVLAESRPHAGIELLFTPKEEVGLLGAYAFDHTRLARARRLRLRPGGADRRGHPRRAVGAAARRHVPRPRGARRHVPRGGPLGDRGGRAGDRRDAARADRRGDDRERRPDRGRHRGEHRPRVLLVRRRGALARRRASSPSSCRRCRTRSRSPPASPSARSRRSCSESYRAYRFRRDDRRSRLAAERARRAAASSRATASRAARADANVFNERGLQCVNLANGMAEIHTPDEHIAVADLEAMVDVTLALVDAASRVGRLRSTRTRPRAVSSDARPTGVSARSASRSPHRSCGPARAPVRPRGTRVRARVTEV